MKKLFFIVCALALLSLSSCTTLVKTASSADVRTSMQSAVVGELKVSPEKISYTYYPPKKVRRGGKKNCINVAIHEALKQYGDADVLVETQEAMIIKFGRKIKSITVTGYPASYVKFTPADKKVVEEMMLNRTLPEGSGFKLFK